MAQHEIQMIHISVCFHTLSIHNFCKYIDITWINIIPLTVNLYRIPEMIRCKVWLYFTIHTDFSVKCNTHKIYIICLTCIEIAILIIIQILCFFPVRSNRHISACTVNTIIFRICTLYKISKCFGITHTNRFSFC